MAEERMDQLSEHLREPFVRLLLSIADDKFMLGHRNADWTGLAPILEEDIAFSSLSQDEIAHAAALYQIVASIQGTKADVLAFGRKPHEYCCAQITELSDEFNWATALARNFFCDHCDLLRLNRLAQSRYTPVAHLGARLAAEEQIHVHHVDSWMNRLGRGGEQAQGRVQEALNALAPLSLALFEATEGLDLLETERICPQTEPSMLKRWCADLDRVARNAGFTLTLPPTAAAGMGGRHGKHSDAFLPLLDELTEVYRIEPEASW
jgi:ring-1,2-phenylacetyl-CoA epoxidase subunit PaaC